MPVWERIGWWQLAALVSTLVRVSILLVALALSAMREEKLSCYPGLSLLRQAPVDLPFSWRLL